MDVLEEAAFIQVLCEDWLTLFSEVPWDSDVFNLVFRWSNKIIK